MSSEYVFRLLAMVPAAQAPTLNDWLSVAFGTETGRTFDVGLNVTGSSADSITHYACCWGLTLVELTTMLAPLCAQAGTAMPENWASWPRADQRAWLIQQAPTIAAQTGVQALAIDDNDGEWSDYQAALSAAGLKITAAELGG